MRERGQIGAGVAYVVESGEALLQPGKFMAAGEVDRSVRGQDAGKQS